MDPDRIRAEHGRILDETSEGPLDLNAFASGVESREITRLAASNGQPVETGDVPVIIVGNKTERASDREVVSLVAKLLFL